MTAEQPHMGTITEGQRVPQNQETPFYDAQQTPRPFTPSINIPTPGETPGVDRMMNGVPAVENAGVAAQRNRGLRRYRTNTGPNMGPSRGHGSGRPDADEYDTDVVDLLDLIGKCQQA